MLKFLRPQENNTHRRLDSVLEKDENYVSFYVDFFGDI
jgi:hypothetical protein